MLLLSVLSWRVSQTKACEFLLACTSARDNDNLNKQELGVLYKKKKKKERKKG